MGHRPSLRETDVRPARSAVWTGMPRPSCIKTNRYGSALGTTDAFKHKALSATSSAYCLRRVAERVGYNITSDLERRSATRLMH